MRSANNFGTQGKSESRLGSLVALLECRASGCDAVRHKDSIATVLKR